jgi:hypothetical protein
MFDRYIRRRTDKSLSELADEAWQQHKKFAGQPWLMCGRRLGKNFLTLLQHWSGAVMCPACLCGDEAAGHNAMRGSGPNR